MNTVFIVPTGIGASIGGHAGDATPAFKLIASLSDIAITHPNVVNASDIHEMPDNTWYVAGSTRNRFLRREVVLKKPKTNRILVVTNPLIRPETHNAVNAARYTIGCEIEILVLNEPCTMEGFYNPDGTAGGSHSGLENLIRQVEEYNDFDALAMATRISVPKNVALNYMKHGGINPWGGIEAIVSKEITKRINKPFAHSPVEQEDPDIKYFNEVVNPRIAAEAISTCFLHCILKGLHKAPRITQGPGLTVEDIDCMITPLECSGEPHRACIESKVPIIAVESNTTCIDVKTHYDYLARNYIEAAGFVQSIKEGIHRDAIG